MGKSTMYAVYRSDYSDKPFRYRIIDTEGVSRFAQSCYTSNQNELSCFCHDKLSKRERIEARKDFDNICGYIQVKLFDFEE